MRTIALVCIGFFFLSSYGQEKIHPNNPNVIIPEGYEPEKWRVLSEQDKYPEAADELLRLVTTDSTRNKHADYWHIGQMYAMDNAYDKAIVYMKKAKDVGNSKDEQWLWYYHGTIAFLNRDKKELKKYTELLEQEHSEYYANNAKVLKSLFENFEKPYKDAY